MGYSRDGRPILQHQPSLDLGTISELTQHRRSRLHWQSITHGPVGSAVLTWTGVGRFKVDYKFSLEGRTQFSQGEQDFVLTFVDQAVGGLHAYFECSSCRLRAEKLYFHAGSWACEDCHELVRYRSRESSRAKRAGRRRELLEEIGDGRPKGMHHRTYAMLKHELQHLNREPGSDDLNAAITEELVFPLRCPPEPGPRMSYNPMPRTLSAYAAVHRAAKSPVAAGSGKRVGF